MQTLQRLQQDYQVALDQVRSRLDDIDTRLLALENTRFSATTQLDGEAIMSLTGVAKIVPWCLAFA
uniref:Uncharacterized protein n=1 Tax=Desertifilum tharense IPPAS B-1220 TaxID=1781255 RepID=A0ACD5GXM9_9CYAN